jgi:hypothetical protein
LLSYSSRCERDARGSGDKGDHPVERGTFAGNLYGTFCNDLGVIARYAD